MKVAVLLSGGVDSSVALHLLKKVGHDVCAFYIKVWLEDDAAFLSNCPWEEDVRYARAVCEQADVALEVLPFQTDYYQRVVQYTLNELKAGRTPSPDVLCNQQIKFGEFLSRIDSSFEKVASGHYARLDELGGQYILKRSPDPIKDQTYFLSFLNQQVLSRVIFPIGHLRKCDVRQIASELKLPNRDRKDSQGVCFLGRIRYREFIRHNLGERTGDIIDIETGSCMGVHPGYWFYTIGQRQGLGLSGGPWYVVSKNIAENEVLVSRKPLLNSEYRVEHLHWIGKPPSEEVLETKIRHSEHLARCRLDLATGRVHLQEPDPGIAEGQFSVFYEGETCLGAGIISRSLL